MDMEQNISGDLQEGQNYYERRCIYADLQWKGASVVLKTDTSDVSLEQDFYR